MPHKDGGQFLDSFPVAGILGNGIGYTLSPMIHGSAERAGGKGCDYQVFDITPENLDTFLERSKSMDELIGFNVTIPYKEELARRLDALHESAREVGAVNTVAVRGGHLIGYNTDRPALERVLSAALNDGYFASAGWTAVVLGAGGVARAAIWAMIDIGMLKHLVMMSRNENRAHALKNDFYVDFTQRSISFSSQKWLDFATLFVDKPAIFINATPLGTMGPSGEIDIPSPAVSHAKLQMFDIVLDLVYAPPETVLTRNAVGAEVYAVGGGGMFIEQALLSREIWFGKHRDEKERMAMVSAYVSWSKKVSGDTEQGDSDVD